MDAPTLRHCATHAERIGADIASVKSPLRRYYRAAFPGDPDHVRILDVGAGTGREMAALVSEPVEAFRDLATQHFPRIADHLRADALPGDLPPLDDLGGPFDGIVCSAVRQHIPCNRLFDSAFALRSLLAPRGRLLASIPAERPGIENERDAAGRLFTGITADELELLFGRVGFVSVERWEGEDAHGRAGHSWVTVCLELRSGGGGRPPDLA